MTMYHHHQGSFWNVVDRAKTSGSEGPSGDSHLWGLANWLHRPKNSRRPGDIVYLVLWFFSFSSPIHPLWTQESTKEPTRGRLPTLRLDAFVFPAGGSLLTWRQSKKLVNVRLGLHELWSVHLLIPEFASSYTNTFPLVISCGRSVSLGRPRQGWRSPVWHLLWSRSVPSMWAHMQ